MANCATTKGVFLYTRHLDSELMVKCQQVLLNNFPNIKFTSVVADENFGGYRVHFSTPDEEAVMAQKYLIVSGQNIRICALKTCLIVHSTASNGDGQLESDIRDAISDRFGKVLYFLVGSPSRQNGNTCYVCRAHVDVPEVKDLPVFDHDGFPEMRVCLRNKRETLKVTFWCTQCKKDGHIKEDCRQVTQPNASSEEERITSTDSENAFTRPVMNFKIPNEWTDSYAQKIGREEIMKAGIFSIGNRNDKEAGPSKLSPETQKPKNNLTVFPPMAVKMEEENDNKGEIKGTYQNNGDHTKERKPKVEIPNMHQGSNSSNSNSHLDNDIQFLAFLDTSNSATEHQTTSIKREGIAETTTSDEALSSPPARPVEYSFASDSATPGPSTSSTRSTRPSKSVEITSILSERLQGCINKACEEIGVLNRQKLDAFLIHVKKKSNPIRVASNYTHDAKKLKEQLQHILTLYYNALETGTKDDISFIKWLNGLVDRFEGTVPRKRRRGDNNT